MNCELVKALLSAYLDNVLALEDRQRAASHLQSCAACSALLVEFRRFDALLSNLPHAEPRHSLRDRIFSSKEYKKLTNASSNAYYSGCSRGSFHGFFNDANNSKFVSIPARRLRKTSEVHSVFTGVLPYRRPSTLLLVMQIAIMICFLLTLAVGGLIGCRLWQKQILPSHVTRANSSIQSTDTLQGPLPAGLRFVFLRKKSIDRMICGIEIP